MDDELDMDSAVDSVISDLGLAGEAPTGDETLPAAATPPEPAAAAPIASAPAAPPSVPKPPASWRKEAQAFWEHIPEAARNEVLKREEDILRGIEEYKAKSAFGEQMRQAIQPFEPYLQQTGAKPEQMFSNLMATHMYLTQGTPEQKMQAFNRFAQEYGIDLQGSGLNPASPQVMELRQAVAALNNQFQTLTRSQQEAKYQENLDLVTKFSQDPAHPHFEAVADIIGQLLERGVAKNLQDAYDKAVWQHPETREKVIAEIQSTAEAKRQKEAKDRADAAKRASSTNLSARDRAGKPTAPLGSIDDTLAETLAEIRSKAA